MALLLEAYLNGAWTDITSYVYNFQFDDNGQERINTIGVRLNMTILSLANFPIFDTEIRAAIDGTYIFGGRVYKPLKQPPFYELVCYSYADETTEILVTEIFTNSSPENIFETLINNYTNLNYASTSVSGFTLERITFNRQPLNECLDLLRSLLRWTYYTDYQKNIYFEPTQTEYTGVTLTVGANVLNLPVWDENSNEIINKVTVTGDLKTFDTSESFTASASQTTFNLTYQPLGSVEVTVNGTRQNPTVDGSFIGDYEINPEDKQIVFSTGLTGGESVIVYYVYATPVTATLELPNVQVTREREVKNKAIKTFSECRLFAQKYLSKFSVGQKSSNLVIQGYNTNLVSGKLSTVIDDRFSINEDLVITKITYKYPDNVSNITVGTNKFLLFNWQAETSERIAALERELQNSDILSLYRTETDNVTVATTNHLNMYSRKMLDSFVWGQSNWGADWGDRSQGDEFTSYYSTSVQDQHTSTLLSYYSFSGTCEDVIGSNDLTNNNSATYTVDKFGETDKAIQFNGSNQWLGGQQPFSTAPSSFTATFWFTRPADSSSALICAAQENSKIRLKLEQTGTSTLQGVFQLGGSDINLTYDMSSLPFDVLHFATLLWNGSTFYLYVNGVMVDSAAASGAAFSGTSASPTLNIAANQGAGNFYGGTLDEIRFYSTSLSTLSLEELWHGYDAPRKGSYNPLDKWDVTGNYWFTVGAMNLNDTSTAVYKEPDTGTYQTIKGKLSYTVDNSLSGSYSVYWNKTTSGSYYKYDLDYDTGSYSVSVYLSTTLEEIQTGTFEQSAVNTLTLRHNTSRIALENGSDYIFDISHGSLTSQGYYEFECNMSKMSFTEIKFYDGDE